jgi:trehalose synthase
MMETVGLLSEVNVPPRQVTRLESVIGSARSADLLLAAARFKERMGGRTVWNVNSTAVGGGVAEMLQCLVGYVEDLAIDIRWLVIGGDPEFFAVTKRLHNQIHGNAADGAPLGVAEADHYAAVLAANARELTARVRPGDIVLLHDPQTAGLVAPLVAAGALPVWRCHIGLDWENDATRQAWDFLRPHLTPARGYVFSRRQYVPSWMPEERAWVIPPSIDPFSPKNQDLDPDSVRAVLTTIGVLDDKPATANGRFVRLDGTVGEVTRAASVVSEGRATRSWSRCRGGTGSRTWTA